VIELPRREVEVAAFCGRISAPRRALDGLESSFSSLGNTLNAEQSGPVDCSILPGKECLLTDQPPQGSESVEAGGRDRLPEARGTGPRDERPCEGPEGTGGTDILLRWRSRLRVVEVTETDE
jgi:hypothetical protein